MILYENPRMNRISCRTIGSLTIGCLIITFLAACGGGGGGSSAPPVQATVQSAPTPAPVVEEPVEEEPPVAEQLAPLDGLTFNEFAEASFRILLLRDPETALTAGVENVPLKLNNLSAQYTAVTYELASGILDRLLALEAQTNVAARTVGSNPLQGIYRHYLEDFITGKSFVDFEYPASYFITGVPSQTLSFFADLHPLVTAQDAADYVDRLGLVDLKINQLIDNVTRAEANGIVMPRLLLDGSINRHQQILGATAQTSPYYQPLAAGIQAISMSQAEKDDLLSQARIIVGEQIIPAYRSLVLDLQQQLSRAPDAVGVGQFQGGQDFYNYALAHHTTTTLSADEIHELGIAELERIHATMRTLFEDLGYSPSASIRFNLGRAATDSGFVAPGQVVAAYEEILAEADSRLAEAFDVFPQAELVVIGGQSGGYYIRASADGSRPGAFYASNTQAEPSYLMKSLAYHEGLPGHHLQIAIAQEQSQSIIQQQLTFTGFVEGWALYAERLASDLGWYADDPLGDLGRLQYEAFRAARLVVDTGIHSRDWEFNQAASFFSQNTGFSMGASEGQIARYAAWPGQATAYMIGMLEILALREKLQANPEFDLVDFHRALLTRGAVPLTMLEEGFD
jgi:uncharacterized protein (DUF885 family)